MSRQTLVILLTNTYGCVPEITVMGLCKVHTAYYVEIRYNFVRTENNLFIVIVQLLALCA